jgi:predicted ABC-type ATPase
MLPKFRLFAGPNGSGKTSLFEYLRKNGFIHTELYINADRFERELKQNLHFNFNAYRVKVSQEEFINFIKASSLSEKIKDISFIDKITIKAGVLNLGLSNTEINSYHASFITSYLVEKLLDTQQSFCFETVMSHKSKVDLIDIAKAKGYKTYLYFVYTDDPELNVTRVKLRALMGLHNVNADVIRNRYKRSFELLPAAIKAVNQTYIINNSDKFAIVADGKDGLLSIKSLISDQLRNLLS